MRKYYCLWVPKLLDHPHWKSSWHKRDEKYTSPNPEIIGQNHLANIKKYLKFARYCVLLQKFNFSTRQFFKILTVNFYCALTQNSLDPDNKTCTYMTIQSLSVMLNVSFFLFYHQNTLKLNVIYTFSISDFTFFSLFTFLKKCLVLSLTLSQLLRITVAC